MARVVKLSMWMLSDTVRGISKLCLLNARIISIYLVFQCLLYILCCVCVTIESMLCMGYYIVNVVYVLLYSLCCVCMCYYRVYVVYVLLYSICCVWVTIEFMLCMGYYIVYVVYGLL